LLQGKNNVATLEKQLQKIAWRLKTKYSVAMRAWNDEVEHVATTN